MAKYLKVFTADKGGKKLDFKWLTFDEIERDYNHIIHFKDRAGNEYLSADCYFAEMIESVSPFGIMGGMVSIYEANDKELDLLDWQEHEK